MDTLIFLRVLRASVADHAFFQVSQFLICLLIFLRVLRASVADHAFFR